MFRDNLKDIKDRIAAAASRVNRSPAEIKLVAVSKQVAADRILEALNFGQNMFGENYVQEALEKIPLVKKRSKQKPIFHFIGKLQSNKAKKAAELFDVIETVDSIKLGLALEKHCAALNKHIDALVQVNIGGENRKSGIKPEGCEEIVQGLRNCKFLNIVGLMTMPPYFTDPEEARPHFIQLRHLAEELQAKNLLGQTGPVELSMGMSGDFEVAIEEGATLVRIGTALFGRRFR
jgi:pyridoxal phosphate enzyme (YggS family)